MWLCLWGLQWGDTPLHDAAHGGHGSVVMYLVGRAADVEAKNHVSDAVVALRK